MASVPSDYEMIHQKAHNFHSILCNEMLRNDQNILLVLCGRPRHLPGNALNPSNSRLQMSKSIKPNKSTHIQDIVTKNDTNEEMHGIISKKGLRVLSSAVRTRNIACHAHRKKSTRPDDESHYLKPQIQAFRIQIRNFNADCGTRDDYA
jgi:hypothetical protein